MTAMTEHEVRELFENVEETLLSDDSGSNARKMIGFFNLCAARIKSVSATAPLDERKEATAVLSALDAARDIIEQVWANVHAGKRLP